MNTAPITFDNIDDCGDLYDYRTGEYLRPATSDERRLSDDSNDNGVFVHPITGELCWVSI